MSAPRPAPHPERSAGATRQVWADRLQRFRTSGLSVAAFCAAEGVSTPTFYQWKRQLASGTPPADAPTILPVRLTNPVPSGPGVEIVLPSGALVRLPADTRPKVLVAILRGVEGRPC